MNIQDIRSWRRAEERRLYDKLASIADGAANKQIGIFGVCRMKMDKPDCGFSGSGPGEGRESPDDLGHCIHASRSLTVLMA